MMFKEIVDDAWRTMDIGQSQKLTMSTLCSGELKMEIELSEWPEDIVGKGEFARYEQFLLSPLCFQKLSVDDASKWV